MKKILVIPDMHHHKRLLKIWDKYCTKVTDIVLLGDFFDDFEVPKNSLEPYVELHKRLLKRRPNQTHWVHGNHELSYTWNRPVTGNNELHREEIQNLTADFYTISNPIVVIDNCIFSHAGISKSWYNNCKRWLQQDIDNKVRNYKSYKKLDLTKPKDLAKYTKSDCWFGGNKISVYVIVYFNC